jgi:mono/diheme cytochrome c family protein
MLSLVSWGNRGDTRHGVEALLFTARVNGNEESMPLRVVLFCALLITLCNLSVAQNPKVINIPAPHTSANSGKQMFDAYCAACHGKDGKGGGPVAPALKVRPTDLTILARQNGGKFPSIQVAKSITGEAGISAHGSKEMPIWGPVFMSMSHQHESVVHLRVANLTEYIKSLQQK